MTKDYKFTSRESEEIIKSFGEEFYISLPSKLKSCSEKWGLREIEIIDSYSANCVFKCQSDKFGACVLKINDDEDEIFSEYNALWEYRGTRFCEVFGLDEENFALLEEYISPATPLRNEKSLEKRVDIFCSLYDGLHIEPENRENFLSYTDWVRDITEYMSQRKDCPELFAHMKKAETIYKELCTVYNRQTLLHGDFHHDNILMGKENEYIIVDPKGVIGDPIFDTPRFILNEFREENIEQPREKINKTIGYFEKNLKIPEEILRKCLYIETAMAYCWNVESGATSEEFARLLRYVEFAESLLI